MPVVQLYQPANPHALNFMHDYVMRSGEAFLRKSKLKEISDDEINKIEENTRDQSASKLWKAERSKRITASRFGSINKATARQNSKLLAASIIGQRSLTTRYTSHGIKYESVAVKNFEKASGLLVKRCGLFVDKEYPFLAATPDGVVDDQIILEVKCPFVAKNYMINETTVPYLKRECNGKLTLSTSHDYYAQVQGQLRCSKREQCYFCVFTLKDFKIFTIKRNEKFIDDMLQKLKLFYNNTFEPVNLSATNGHFTSSML
ncbi:PREDICTED: uncharacterized protein LOC106815870 [Priapulus caudatus]|uniref:Uncharacterized protein LOC106815870 n=1 Tax=Priapulus caudatus TaxID=37621 RepID=A0ABM1EUK9_PRICU|nr:PREDICTED: uncharacterized protein LOC106815870 [Priapulus caudatus]